MQEDVPSHASALHRLSESATNSKSAIPTSCVLIAKLQLEKAQLKRALQTSQLKRELQSAQDKQQIAGLVQENTELWAARSTWEKESRALRFKYERLESDYEQAALQYMDLRAKYFKERTAWSKQVDLLEHRLRNREGQCAALQQEIAVLRALNFCHTPVHTFDRGDHTPATRSAARASGSPDARSAARCRRHPSPAAATSG